jgi:hypothetical protein
MRTIFVDLEKDSVILARDAFGNFSENVRRNVAGIEDDLGNICILSERVDELNVRDNFLFYDELLEGDICRHRLTFKLGNLLGCRQVTSNEEFLYDSI